MTAKRKIGRFFLLLLFVVGGFLLARNVLALDVGTNEITNTIGLGSEDPRKIISRVINVAMMFLGIVAVVIIIFAGFKWMTSQGNEEKIEDAKKILKAGVIGLVIILASWGIAAFILNRLLGATGNQGGTGPGGNSTSTLPCTGNGCAGMACDDLPLVPGCNYSTSSCQAGLACNPGSCTCQPCPPGNPSCGTNPGGNYGDACDGDLTNNDPTPTCDADNTMCDQNQGLTCDINTCTCLGSPVITDISPVGGFCENDINESCNSDDDCVAVGGTCNIDTPNGAPDNIISIHGYNFGTSSTSTSWNNNFRSNNWLVKIKKFFNLDFGVKATAAAGVSQVIFLGNESDPNDDVVAINPVVLNSNCTDTWTNYEVIVAIPAGAPAGPLKLVNGNLNNGGLDNDTTSNEVGPQLPDFVPNTIERPGICQITPDQGLLGDSVSYYGVNLSGDGFFGNEQNRFKGITSTFNGSGLAGTVTVPNVGAGYMSTFVMNPAENRSNYVSFRKNQEPPAPPSISGFEPAVGAAGQYVTIRGNGFGSTRGASRVLFGTTEADYNFPTACLQSVWSDGQVIVKVPAGIANGNYNINMEIGSWDIQSSSQFTVDAAAPLMPSLCKISPNRGPANANVSLWGEYFGNIGQSVTSRFYNQQDTDGIISDDNNANRLNVLVPAQAVTGPVAVLKNNAPGNGLNFVVGACTNNNQCDPGSPVCCPFGSPNQGQCVAGMMDPQNGCYSNIPNSVFEWTFGTSLAVACDSDPNTPACEIGQCAAGTTCDINSCTCQPCPPENPTCGQVGSPCDTDPGNDNGVCNPNDNLCALEYVCDPSDCLCKVDAYSCAQAGGGGTCPAGFCPNSPGQCSPYGGGNPQPIGSCNDSCNYPLSGCTSGSCHYNSDLNKCISDNDSCTPPTDLTYELGPDTFQATMSCNPQQHLQISVSTTCPNGWTSVGGGKCVDFSSTCENCPALFSCSSAPDYYGQCINTAVICPTGAVCQGSTCQQEDEASCECCCEEGQDARDCCAPLTCAGSCGNGSYTDEFGTYHDFGYCSGCLNAGTTQEEHDDACNCAGTSGKFCQDDGATGICVDCTALSQGDCVYGDHSSVCCWDDKDDACRSGNGNLVPSSPGHCAFYGCGAGSPPPSECASSTPGVYSVPSGSIYKTISQCTTACASNNPNLSCALTTDENNCRNKVGCCWDLGMGAGSATCVSGNKIPSSGSDPGACDYYNCQSGTSACNTTNPLSSGSYPTLSSCGIGCNLYNLGGSCSATLLNGTTTQACNISSCGSPFACLDNTFQLVSSTTPPGNNDCGFCCCDPNEPTNMQCGSINPVLSCVKDKGNCTGSGRGLCCGCQADNQCGNTTSIGCANDSCCHNRPSVLVNSLTPSINQNNVCRNSVISVPFNEKMLGTSFTGNILLLAETSGNCPAGTYQLALGPQSGQQNILARWYHQISNFIFKTKNTIARWLGLGQALAYVLPAGSHPIDPSATYCATPGQTTVEHTSSNTILHFEPASVLLPNTHYFALVKGQENLDSLASSTALGKAGVLSQYRVGMAAQGLALDGSPTNWHNIFGEFNGQNYINSFSWHFKTQDANNATNGLCLLDRVELTPESYLFQKNANGLNESDTDAGNETFDTVADRDKLYTAKALSTSGQEIQPVVGYDWTWSWSIVSPDHVDFATVGNLASNGKQRLAAVMPGIVDKTVTIKAQTVMNPTNAYNTPNKFKEVPARVFVCSNPWPPVNNVDFWEPARDSSVIGVYDNYSYEFYYCRDAGDPATTDDDLPAISSGNDIINLGLSNRKVCSNKRTTECTADTDCPTGGFCIWDILKESYFFEQ